MGWKEKGYKRITLCCHLEHASGTPLALLFAFTLRLPHESPKPDLLPVLTFMVWYISMTLCNYVATNQWQYPIIGEAQKTAGFVGVFLFFGLITGIFIASACFGIWIIS